MTRNFRALAGAALLLSATAAAADPLTLEQVVQLSSAGIGDDAIIAKIKASGTRLDLSTDQMMALKGKGVSGPVIAAMISGGTIASAQTTLSVDSPDPLVPHAPGVYAVSGADAAHMVRIDPTTSSQAKTGGILGYAFSYGIASMHIKAAIQGDSARTKTTAAPVFYFFFDESNPDSGRMGSTWLAGVTTNVSSPNEFSLVRLMRKSGRREANVGSMNIAGAKTGVMDHDRVDFHYDLVRPGVYKIMPSGPLTPGEYGFIASISGTGSALTARIFDFSVS